MKGAGTFRRAMGAVSALVGLGASQRVEAVLEPERHKIPLLKEERKPRRSGKWRPKKHRHTTARKNWPLVFWGMKESDCQKPLSRKQLKRLCPDHVLLKR